MRAVRVHEYGGPELMKVEELPTPEPGPGQVLVQIAASGVNFIDIYHRTGLYKVPLPYALGIEGAGTVQAVGPDVADVRVGDAVAWKDQAGSYATHVVVPATALVPVPEGVSLRDAAAIVLQGLTAHYLTHSTYPIAAGETCLIHAAAGGVGLLLCQMAKMRGARVIGTVSSDEKAQLASEAGADEVIMYTRQDFESEVKRLTDGRGVNVVYDGVGREVFDKNLNCLVPRGYEVLFGQSSGPVPPLDPQVLNGKGSLFLTRPTLGHYTLTREELLGRASDLFGWIDQGKLKVRIGRTFPLDDAAQAHIDLNGRKTTGKVLLEP
jgi:NADPH2:quinone reductase